MRLSSPFQKSASQPGRTCFSILFYMKLFKSLPISALAALLFFASVSAQSSPDSTAGISASELSKKVDVYLEAHHQNNTFSGLVFIRTEDELITGRAGFATIEDETPFRIDHLFRIGSLSKPVVASWFIYMEDQGELSINDPLSGWLPDYPNSEAITLEHLLSHTSGIPNFTSFDNYPDLMHLPATPDEIIARFSDADPLFEPGKQFAYSNSNYILLSRIMELETGESFADAINAFIKNELGISGMEYEKPGSEYPDLVSGYSYDDGPVPAMPIHMSVPLGAGGLIANGQAILDFVDALYDGSFISEKALRRMTDPRSGNYALGLGVGPVLSQPSVGHTGGINGFASNLIYLPEKEITVLVLSNLETAQVGPIVRDLLSMAMGRPYTVPEVREEIKVAAELLESYTGLYEIAPGFELRVKTENGKLIARATGQQPIELHAETETLFFTRMIDARIEFNKDDDGKVESLTLYQAGQTIEAPKINRE